MPMNRLLIGWDVGGWNCDRNPQSRDAIVLLDTSMRLVGTPWRGNLRNLINEVGSALAFVKGLVSLCRADLSLEDSLATLVIDTPLAFPKAFRQLLDGAAAPGPIGASADNPYLYRRTELFLHQRGWRPMSSLKDMIGSQATKGMHVLAKVAPHIEVPGVWTDGRHLQAMEGYPTTCREAGEVQSLRALFPSMGHPDLEDALLCALVAYLYATRPQALAGPLPEMDPAEGWIWVPKSATKKRPPGGGL